MGKRKILFLTNNIMHYRIPFWNALAEKYDLTIGYSLGDIPSSIPINFEIIKLPIHFQIGRIVIHKDNIKKLARKYDCVISYGNVTWFSFSTLPFFKVKTIFFGIGVSASYTSPLDSVTRWDRIRDFFYSKASALAFYSDYPIKKAKKKGQNIEKMFVAPNTVEVIDIKEIEKTDLLFIGSLYKEKGIGFLLEAYKEARNEVSNLPILKIIGAGSDENLIKEWIIENNLENEIILLGPIYSTQEKAKHFAAALACISPLQAGLSVLESMGYGVPFITTKNAITGGEIFNIKHGETGILMNEPGELTDILIQIATNPQRFKKMGENAKQYYKENRTINHMAKGMSKAIDFALLH